MRGSRPLYLGICGAIAAALAALAGQAPAAAGPSGGHGDHAAGPPGEVLALDAAVGGEVVDLLLAVRGEKVARLVHRRSTDGGRSWGAETEVPLGGKPVESPHRGMDPQIAADGDRLLAVWTAPGTSPWGSGPLATALSADGGRTWTPGPAPADDGTTDGHNYVDAVADGRGGFHLVWLDDRGGSRGLRAARSADGGRTWSANRTIDGETCECCWNRLAAGPDGAVRVLYRDRLPNRDMVVAASADGGESWRGLGAAGDFDWVFDGCPHAGGGLAVSGAASHLSALVWTGAEGKAGLWLVGSADGGRSWSEPRRMGSDRARNADLAAAGGRLVAAWDQDRRIHAAVSADGGLTWSAAEPISEPGRHATHPLVVAAGDGALVLWTETPEDGAAGWVARRFPG